MKIILTGGGTGGHLFPAIALAEIFKERDSGNEITFIGSKKGLEAKILYKYGFHLETLDVGGVKGKGLLNRAISILKALMGIFKSIKLIRRYMPDLVVGAGGYSAFPVVAAAKIMKVMTIILEQNTLPGITNRYLGRFVDRVFVAFPDAKKYFPKGKVVVSGNPVRKEILKAKGERRKAKGEGFTILVFGGSQGAKAINSIFLESLEYLKHCSINIIHQTGEEDYERVKETYNKLKTQN
ncbi:MAG: UDP-N-acetylglucosamine--N-acetylmuramyl-(pentapeptide) pyrophosphoryl-undecaprenol N-acetylglucosamine transferase [Deltaproteobacteria bacterium]|nr:UDP-N-acetylglucosamine--N-acetylmuramyl-(pentapeptide) pyrophosphoryl-undecaprenol N-acetylglucosamine transferase [Deltaproteobacteria bacterium]